MMKKVILIEDNRIIREIVSAWLIDEDCEVKTLTNTNKLEQVIRVFQADLLITDIMLPNTTATELIQCFSVIHVPIVVLSSMDKEDILYFSNRIGALAFFQKPLELKDLFVFLHDFFKKDNLTLVN